MKNKIYMRAFFCLTTILIFLVFTGCAYFKNRGNDALDIFDIGFSVNPKLKPQFGLYLDFFNSIPLGYSNIDAKCFGIGYRQAGWMNYVDKNWGVLAIGEEQRGYGKFNPKDPHQARPDQQDLTEFPNFGVGLANTLACKDLPPTLQFFECHRLIHLGWIGLYLHIRPLDIIDFIVGWSTLDITGDDLAD